MHTNFPSGPGAASLPGSAERSTSTWQRNMARINQIHSQQADKPTNNYSMIRAPPGGAIVWVTIECHYHASSKNRPYRVQCSTVKVKRHERLPHSLVFVFATYASSLCTCCTGTGMQCRQFTFQRITLIAARRPAHAHRSA